jgi:F-type H+-transporting ATPase subunit delta
MVTPAPRREIARHIVFAQETGPGKPVAATDQTIEKASPSAHSAVGAAGRYAKALLDLADDRRGTEPGAADRIGAELEALFALCRDNADVHGFITDPRFNAAIQRDRMFKILDRVGIGGEVRNLVGVLIANRRLAALPAVARAFGALIAARRGQQMAEVTTAHALTDTQRAQIAARLTEAGYSNVRLSETIDKSILGGLIVRIGSRLYDNSIKSKLQRLQYAMKGAA